MPRILSDESLDTLFRNASPQPVWLDRPVGDTLLRALWELVRAAPAAPGSCRVMPNPVTGSGDAPGLTGAPILLAIETAGSRCSAAVTRGERILASVSQALRHGHGEALLPIVDRAMSEAEIKPSQLTMVAVAIGPGGFTGIRVGLAAAQGIALATGARLLGVTGFAAVAQALRRTGPGDAVPGANLLVALDSRRDDLYVQLF